MGFFSVRVSEDSEANGADGALSARTESSLRLSLKMLFPASFCSFCRPSQTSPQTNCRPLSASKITVRSQRASERREHHNKSETRNAHVTHDTGHLQTDATPFKPLNHTLGTCMYYCPWKCPRMFAATPPDAPLTSSPSPSLAPWSHAVRPLLWRRCCPGVDGERRGSMSVLLSCRLRPDVSTVRNVQDSTCDPASRPLPDYPPSFRSHLIPLPFVTVPASRPP